MTWGIAMRLNRNERPQLVETLVRDVAANLRRALKREGLLPPA